MNLSDMEILTSQTLKQIYRSMSAERAKSLMAWLDRIPPEEREKRRMAYEKEQKRLAAIEAAKTPAQRLKEKQAACTHHFDKLDKNPRFVRCTGCNLRLSKHAALWYHAGYDDGYQKRGQHETDEE
jgi:hypothetical protein